MALLTVTMPTRYGEATVHDRSSGLKSVHLRRRKVGRIVPMDNGKFYAAPEGGADAVVDTMEAAVRHIARQFAVMSGWSA